MRANAEFNYITKNGNSYLEFKANDQMTIDHVEVGMIQNNKIPGLLEMTRSQNDGETTLLYCITSKTSLSQIFSNQMNRNELRQILGSMCQFMSTASEYMLYTEHLILNTEYIFVDFTTKEISMVLLPIEEEIGENIAFTDFIRQLIFHIKYDPTDTSGFYINLINYINSVVNFSPADLLKALNINGAEKPVREAQGSKPQQQMPDSIHTTQEHAVQNVAAPKEMAPVQQPEAPKPGLMHNLKGVLGNSSDAKKKEVKPDKQAAPAVTPPQAGGMNIPGMPKKNGMNIPMPPSPAPEPKKAKKEKKEFFSFGKKRDKKQTVQKPTVPAAPQMQGMPVMRNTTPASNIPTMQNMVASNNIFDSTVILDEEDDRTVVLGSEVAKEKSVVKLVSRKTGQEILITKNEFKIGRESKFVDGVVSNPTVGRMHASLVNENEKWYVIDNNSVNGTYINGSNQRIASNQKVVLNHNDTLCFGNEEYIFYQ